MDPISSMIAQIKNALAVKKPFISIPASNFKYEVAYILVDLGYLRSVAKVGRGVKKYLKIELKYDSNGDSVLKQIKKISKPGQRIYLPKHKIKAVKSGLGCLVVSTSGGLMTNKEARKKGLGGEIICEVF
jgi:small subunit ribosomal protein S8